MRKPLVMTALAGCLLILTAVALFQRMNHRLDATKELLRQTEERRANTSERLRAFENRVLELAEKLEAAQEENKTLRSTLQPSAAGPASPLNVPPRLSHAMVGARFEHARTLAKSGKHAEALAEFLWCYDEGMPRVAAFGGVRESYLLNEIARLGEQYPVALDALRVRRDQMLDAIIADPDDRSAFSEFSSLNHALKEDQQNLALWEKLPAGDPRRSQFGLQVYEDLARSRRYADALEAYPYRTMTSLFDSLIEEYDAPADWSAEKIANMRRSARSGAIKTAASNLEVLLGADQLDQAREFAAKVLAYDASESTRQALRAAATRAGRADFVLP